jgi:hypothetical protein
MNAVHDPVAVVGLGVSVGLRLFDPCRGRPVVVEVGNIAAIVDGQGAGESGAELILRSGARIPIRESLAQVLAGMEKAERRFAFELSRIAGGPITTTGGPCHTCGRPLP